MELLGWTHPIGEQGYCSRSSHPDSGKREGHLRACQSRCRMMDKFRPHTVDERNIFCGGGIIIGMIEPFVGLLMPSLTNMHE